MAIKKIRKNTRVFWITLIVLAVISFLGWLRFQQALRLWYYLLDVGIQPAPIYLAASGALIGLSHTVGLLAVAAGRGWSRTYLRVTNVTLLVWLWVDRVFLVIRDFFPLLLAGLIFFTILLAACDFFLYRRISFPKKAVENAPED